MRLSGAPPRPKSAMRARGLVAPLLCAAAASAFTLRDAPIATASSPLYLDGAWQAAEPSLGLNITATVPGDIITDLQRAGVIPDPWYELTWLDNRTLWDVSIRSWTFSRGDVLLPTHWLPPAPPAPPAPFPSSSSPSSSLSPSRSSSPRIGGGRAGDNSSSTLLLVFEGIKMGARVSFNGVELGVVTNQFLRSVFSIPSSALMPAGAPNNVSVSFDASLALDGRFMPCTGGWDWAPMSQTYLNDSVWGTASTFSSGIWKSVYITSVAEASADGPSSVAITHLVPLVTYLGPYPVGALTDGGEGAHAGFEVSVTAHLWAPEGGATGSLAASGEWGATAGTPGPVSVPAGASNFTFILQAPASAVSLWWPNGMGARPLYNVSVTWTPAAAGASAPFSAVRRIGFRVAALVTVNDTNATIVSESTGADGSGSFGMFFRINGAAIFARGADLVPTEALEGRLDATAFHTIVQSAAAAGMNMMRIWGGGIYPPDVFYDTCDEEGVLLYHDLMFAGNGHDISSARQPFSAATNATILAEISHQIRRLSPHPSVVLYDGANEVIVQRSGPTALYATLVMAAVAKEDPTRILWPASPAAGWVGGVDRLWGTPNGKPLVPVGSGHIWDAGNERHGPYTAGVGSWNWTTVVRDPWTQAQTFDPGVPLAYLPGPGSSVGGPGAPSVFASEFGTMSMSSFEAMSASLSPSSWGIHGGGKASECVPDPDHAFVQHCTGRNAMAQRNWAADSLVWSYFGPALLNASGETAFKAQLYQNLVASAIHMQLDIEARRAGNNMGALIWQLQETWSTGGWGSLEYGAPGAPGILRGGRWKPAHNWLASHMFADVMSACGHVGRSKTFVCYVSNARSGAPFAGTLSITAVDLLSGAESVWGSWPVEVGPGPGALSWVTPSAALPANTSTTVLVATLDESTGGPAGAPFDEHVVHLAAPASLIVDPAAAAALAAAVSPTPNADGSVNVTVSAGNHVALFVTLTSAAPGRFSENAFLVRAGAPRPVVWIPFEPGNATADAALLASTLRVEDMSAYQA